jgi:hypothetical protein
MPGDNDPPTQVRATAAAAAAAAAGRGGCDAAEQGLVLDFISGISVSCHRLCTKQLQGNTGSTAYVYAVAASVVVMAAGEV